MDEADRIRLGAYKIRGANTVPDEIAKCPRCETEGAEWRWVDEDELWITCFNEGTFCAE